MIEAYTCDLPVLVYISREGYKGSRKKINLFLMAVPLRGGGKILALPLRIYIHIYTFCGCPKRIMLNSAELFHALAFLLFSKLKFLFMTHIQQGF